jgi:hypothetical protein
VKNNCLYRSNLTCNGLFEFTPLNIFLYNIESHDQIPLHNGFAINAACRPMTFI